MGPALTWWLMAVAASDAASLAMADSYPPGMNSRVNTFIFQRPPPASSKPSVSSMNSLPLSTGNLQAYI